MSFGLRPTAHHLTLLLGPGQGRLVDEQGRVPEQDLIDWCKTLVKKNELFVDVGAHIGTYSLVLAAHCKEVHAFEASENTFRQLCANTLINHAPNVRLHRAALGSPDERGKTRTLFVLSQDGRASVDCIDYRPALRREPVAMECLDDRDWGAGCQKIGLLRVAAGGHGAEVLRGARRLVTEHRPRILVRAAELQQPAVFRFLNEVGYTITRVRGHPALFLGAPP